MKKLILILLTAAMLCALLCGCPKEGPVTPETTAPSGEGLGENDLPIY